MKVKLWTIRDESEWKELQTKGVFKTYAKNIDAYFKEGYDWMRSQMNKRIGRSTEQDQYPVWAWYQAIDEKRRRPDLRKSAHLPGGTVGYRIEIEKEEKDILLSDFELWHTPLSYKVFIANSEEEQALFEPELLNKFGTDSYERLPERVKKKFQDSWEKIFDMDFDVEHFARPFQEKQIQATFWKLNINEVVKVDRFIAR